MTKIAMISPQGTACSEATLVGGEDTPQCRASLERQLCHGGPDDPIAGSWTDVSHNDAC